MNWIGGMYEFVVKKGNLADIKAIFLAEVAGGRVDYLDTIILVSLNAVCLYQLRAVNENILGNSVQCPTILGF
jgi:hypothetical protein